MDNHKVAVRTHATHVATNDSSEKFTRRVKKFDFKMKFTVNFMANSLFTRISIESK